MSKQDQATLNHLEQMLIKAKQRSTKSDRITEIELAITLIKKNN
jgi:hypothetical protein